MVDHLLSSGGALIGLSSSQTSLFLLAFSTISIVSIVALLARRRRKALLDDPLAASNSRLQPLFNRVEVRLGDGQSVIRDAFLRSLTPGRATILMQGFDVPKGLPVEIDLSSLNAGFESSELLDRRSSFGLVQGRVVRVQPLGADDKNILVNVSFNDKNAVPPKLLKQDAPDALPKIRAVSASSQLEIL